LQIDQATAAHKVQQLKSGRTIGGIPFTRGPLSYLLRNRFFVGEVAYKGEALSGPQPPILDRALFDAVQAKLAEQHNNHAQNRLRSEALLVGKIYDDRSHRMSPSHSRKKGVRYRYFLSLPLLDGRPEEAGSISRVPAAEIEHVVADAVRQELGIDPELGTCDLIEGHVTRARGKLFLFSSRARARIENLRVRNSCHNPRVTACINNVRARSNAARRRSAEQNSPIFPASMRSLPAA
jgi:Recombinase